MYQAVWKLSALAIVVGVGVLVVVQAQRDFNKIDQGEQQEQEPVLPAAERAENDPADEWDTLTSQRAPKRYNDLLEEDSETVPTSTKTAAARRDRHPAALEEEDPFVDSAPSGQAAASRATKKTAARDRVDDKPPARLTLSDDELSLDEPESTAVTPKRREPAEEDEDPFDRKGRTGRNDSARGSATSRRGPALGLSGEDDDKPLSEAAPPSAGKRRKTSGPRLLSDPDDKLEENDKGPRFSPVGGEETDPLAEEESAIRNREPADSEKTGDDNDDVLPRSSSESDPPRRLRDAEKRGDDSHEPADDDMPLIERDAPQRKPVPPAAPRLDDENTDEADSFAKGRTRRDDKQKTESSDDSKPAPTTRPTFENDDSDDPAPFHRETPAARPAPTKLLDDEVPAQPATNDPPRGPSTRADDSEAQISRPAPRRAPQPQLTIDKSAPATAVLGKPMVYQIVVKNAGKLAARQVVVEDAVPEAARIDGSIPQALLENRRLIWKLGTLDPGQERKILVRIIPQSEGTLGTVATVNCARVEPGTNPAAPQLKFELLAPAQAVVGAPVAIKFRVTNVGDVNASGVVIRDVLPAGLRHPDGDDLEYEMGALEAGKSREVELTLTAAQAGKTVNRAIVTAEGNVTEEATASLDIVGPALTISRSGPRRLFPGKSGTYANTVTNPNPQTIASVRVVETIPSGMEFVSASDGGQYDKAKRTVTWTLGRIEPQESKALKTTLSSSSRGAQISVVRAFDASGATGETVGTTHVAGVPALTIDLSDLAPHVEQAEQVRVPIRIVNRGSDTASGIRTSVTLPPELEFVSAQAPVEYSQGADAPIIEKLPGAREQIAGDPAATVIRFSPIKRLDPKETTVIELTLRARRPGNARLKVAVDCEQIAEPVSREEITTVAAPQE